MQKSAIHQKNTWKYSRKLKFLNSLPSCADLRFLSHPFFWFSFSNSMCYFFVFCCFYFIHTDLQKGNLPCTLLIRRPSITWPQSKENHITGLVRSVHSQRQSLACELSRVECQILSMCSQDLPVNSDHVAATNELSGDR